MPDGPHAVGSSSIGAVLASRGLLSGAALDRARRLEAESGERIDRVAAKLGLVSERDLAAAYAELIGSPIVVAAEFPAEPVGPERIRRMFLKQARLIPLAESEAALVVAMADPFDDEAARALEFALDKEVRRRVALPADIEAAYERLYGEGRSAIDRISDAAGEREDEDRDADLERLKDLSTSESRRRRRSTAKVSCCASSIAARSPSISKNSVLRITCCGRLSRSSIARMA